MTTDFSPSALATQGPWLDLWNGLRQRYGLGARLYLAVTDASWAEVESQLDAVDSLEHVTLSAPATDLYYLSTNCQGSGSRIYVATKLKGTLVPCKSADLTTLRSHVVDAVQAFSDTAATAQATLFDPESKTVLVQRLVADLLKDADFPGSRLRMPTWKTTTPVKKSEKQSKTKTALIFIACIAGSLALATALVLFYEFYKRRGSSNKLEGT